MIKELFSEFMKISHNQRGKQKSSLKIWMKNLNTGEDKPIENKFMKINSTSLVMRKFKKTRDTNACLEWLLFFN